MRRTEIDEELFDQVGLKDLETEDVQDADRATGAFLLLLGHRRCRTVGEENDIHSLYDEVEQLGVDRLRECVTIRFGLGWFQRYHRDRATNGDTPKHERRCEHVVTREAECRTRALEIGRVLNHGEIGLLGVRDHAQVADLEYGDQQLPDRFDLSARELQRIHRLDRGLPVVAVVDAINRVAVTLIEIMVGARVLQSELVAQAGLQSGAELREDVVRALATRLGRHARLLEKILNDATRDDLATRRTTRTDWLEMNLHVFTFEGERGGRSEWKRWKKEARRK